MKTFNTVILVYGKILRNALRNIFNGAMNFSLTDNENSEVRKTQTSDSHPIHAAKI